MVAGIYLFPNLLPAVTYSVFIAQGNVLDFQVAAASMVIFGLMQGPLIQVPFFFSEIINLVVSMRRIEGFLDLDEVQNGIIDKNPESEQATTGIAFSIKGNFSWGFSTKKKEAEEDSDGERKESSELPKEEKSEDKAAATLGKFMTLKGLDLEVYPGELVCVIGDVGSGKSSLLNAIIGDMIYVPDAEI